MESLPVKLLTWQTGGALGLIYLLTLAFYRLYLHPLAKFPGPKIAAVTRYYEAYHDIIRGGQYTFEIAKMHKKYGPIVRISPHELHINDPSYYEKLYRHDGRWDKYAWAIDAHYAPGAIIFTADSQQHKARRQPLNAYFSKARVAAHQGMVRSTANRLCERLAEFAREGRSVDFGAAISAYTRDISVAFVLGRSYNGLEEKDFNVDTTNAIQGAGGMWRTTKHIPWFAPLMHSIPKDFLIKNGDPETASIMRFVKASEADTARLLAAATSENPEDKQNPTIVDEIVKSNLPAEDKAFNRVLSDILTVTGAGFETTASVLRLLIYHLYTSPSILNRLREEISSISADRHADIELRTLEQLPYLTAVIMEAMRLSPALGTRLQRIAPDRDLIYDKWVIPAGTPVGMTALFMHMDEKLYPDPEKFDPERWVDVESRKRHEKVYAPFSRGSRICLGMHLAWADMYLVVAALVQRLDFDFGGVPKDHFEFVNDMFIIGYKGKTDLTGQPHLRD